MFSFGHKAAERFAHAVTVGTAARDAWLRAAFEAAPIGLATATLDGRWLHVNENCCHLLGYSHSELVHYSLNHLTHPEDASKELTMIRRVLAGEQRQYRIEKRIIDKSGKYRMLLVSASLVRGTHSGPDVMVYVIEPPETPAESGQDAGHMAISILEQLADAAVIRTDARGMITGWNKGAERFLGYPRQEIIGKNRRLFYRDQDNWEDRPLTHLRLATEQGHHECDEFRVTREGSHVWLHSSLTPYAPDGTVRGFVEVLSTKSEQTVDMKPVLDQAEELRHERDRLLHDVDELRRQGVSRDQELQILAAAIRNETERRHEAEKALREMQQETLEAPQPVVAEAEQIAAPATLELAVEPPWSTVEAKPLELLIDIAANRRTGSLILAHGTSHKALFFDNGRLTCIASDDPNDFLGERLVRSGLITEPQRNKALQLAETTDLAFARCLVILGAISDDVVSEALRGKLEDDVEVLAGWDGCSWSFLDREPPHRKLLTLSIDVYDLRAVREAIGSRTVRALRAVSNGAETEPAPVSEEPAPDTNPPRYVATRNGSRFHLTSCISVRRVPQEGHLGLATKREAKKRGLSPCGICMK